MKRLLLLSVFLLLLSLRSSSAQSGSFFGRPGAPGDTAPSTAPPIIGGDELRRYLVGSTWSWEPEGKSPSEITFLADGTVKHNAFVGKWFVRSRSDVVIQLDRRTAPLKFDASYTHYTAQDFDGRTLAGTQRMGSAAAAARAGAAGGKPGVSDPTLERDLHNLSAAHSGAVATAAAPFNKKFQADLAPLLKRAQQSGDAAMIQKIQGLIAAQNFNLDGTSWHLDGNSWVETLRFNHGILSVFPRNGAGSRDQPYKMGGDGNVVFPFDGRDQTLVVAPDHTALSWEGQVFEPQAN